MNRLQVRKLGYALGAEISGIDVRNNLDDATIDEIRRIWLDNVIVCIRDQDIEAADLVAFVSRFGDVDDNRNSPQNRHPDHAPIMALSNKPVMLSGKMTGGYKNGDRWHSDLAYTPRPCTGSFLVAKDIPEVGGDTAFANCYTAYDTLSPAMKAIVDDLKVVYDIASSPSFNTLDPQTQAARRRDNPPRMHPCARVHPETGRKALFVSERVNKFAGLTVEESKPILDFLVAHCTRYEFVYRHKWRPHDMMIWDNRCALHIAIPDFDQTKIRRMMRCSLLGPESGEIYDEATYGKPREAAATAS